MRLQKQIAFLTSALKITLIKKEKKKIKKIYTRNYRNNTKNIYCYSIL